MIKRLKYWTIWTFNQDCLSDSPSQAFFIFQVNNTTYCRRSPQGRKKRLLFCFPSFRYVCTCQFLKASYGLKMTPYVDLSLTLHNLSIRKLRRSNAAWLNMVYSFYQFFFYKFRNFLKNPSKEHKGNLTPSQICDAGFGCAKRISKQQNVISLFRVNSTKCGMIL